MSEYINSLKRALQIFKKYYIEGFFMGITLVFSPVLLSLNLKDLFNEKYGLRKKGSCRCFCRKILVIQAAKLGDMACSTPVFREIKKQYPECYLMVACLKNVAPVLINNPHINEIIHLDDFICGGLLKKIKFIQGVAKKKIACSITLLPGLPGAVVPLWAFIPKRIITTSQYASETSKILSWFFRDKLEYQRHTLTVRHYLNLLKFIGIDSDNLKKELFFSSQDEIFVNYFLRKNNLECRELLIGSAITAGNVLKEWSPERFVQLFDKLIDRLGAKIIVVGSLKDKEKIRYVQSKMKNKIYNAADVFNLSQLSCLLSKLKLFVSVDTGPLYMANAVGTPVVDIAGPIDIYEQPPLGEKCAIVQKKIDCLPCSFVFPPARKCRNQEKLKCLKIITVDDVYNGIAELMKEENIWNV